MHITVIVCLSWRFPCTDSRSLSLPQQSWFSFQAFSVEDGDDQRKSLLLFLFSASSSSLFSLTHRGRTWEERYGIQGEGDMIRFALVVA